MPESSRTQSVWVTHIKLWVRPVIPRSSSCMQLLSCGLPECTRSCSFWRECFIHTTRNRKTGMGGPPRIHQRQRPSFVLNTGPQCCQENVVSTHISSIYVYFLSEKTPNKMNYAFALFTMWLLCWGLTVLRALEEGVGAPPTYPVPLQRLLASSKIQDTS